MRKKEYLFLLPLALGLVAAVYFYNSHERKEEHPSEEILAIAHNLPIVNRTPHIQMPKASQTVESKLEDIHEYHQSPSSRWGKWEHSKIDEWIKQGNACALLNSKLLYEAPLREILSNLLSNAATSSNSTLPSYVLEDLADTFSAEHEEEAVASLRKHSHPILRFYEALILAGLLEGMKAPVAKNLDRSAMLLQSLTQEQKNNGAIFLYLAKVKQDQGVAAENTLYLLRDAFNAPEFSTYVTEIMQPINEIGLQSPALWSLSKAFRNHVPIPNYASIRSVISEGLKISGASFAEEAYGFALRIMQRNEAEAKGSEIVYWLALEHATAKSIAQNAWKKLHPAEDLPLIARGEYQALMKSNIINREMPEALSNAFFQQENCEKNYPRLFSFMLRERQEYLQRRVSAAAR